MTVQQASASQIGITDNMPLDLCQLCSLVAAPSRRQRTARQHSTAAVSQSATISGKADITLLELCMSTLAVTLNSAKCKPRSLKF
jgi:hypothetical protein